MKSFMTTGYKTLTKAEDAMHNLVYLIKSNLISSTYHSVVANYITCQTEHDFFKFSNYNWHCT